jgi:hypothetical protein
MIVVRDTGSMLVHAHDRGIDHLHRRIMTGGQRIYDLVPDASPPPPNEAVVTSGAGTIGLWQVAPCRHSRERGLMRPSHAVSLDLSRTKPS